MSSNLAVAREKGKGECGVCDGIQKETPGGNAGCNACRVLSCLGDCTCRADKAFTPHPLAIANYCLRKKSLYNIYKCAALQEKFGAPCCAPVSGL
ncbi:hypothetical protein BXT93_22205 [Escherichia coli]|uniref:Uncharacterized protein n=1 Tax=Escherichia coli TaxID=562 RepID=A0A1V2G6R0_ECOLX|nr:hypothetical protein BWR13_24075 [Escherichia coli]ONG30996.1 hypothetical protein BXT93_22205 [Escherichia coli]